MLGIFIMLATVKVNAQSAQRNRESLQQEFIEKHFMTPQFRDHGNLKITSTGTIDSLFTAINTEWIKVAPDTLRKYNVQMPLEDFKHIDAYCYFLTLVTITQHLDLALKYKEHLVSNYMIPAMRNDLVTLQQRPVLTSLQLIHSGTLHNTLAIGSGNGMSKETVLASYQVYASFKEAFSAIAKGTDTAMVNYAKIQLKEMETFKYDLNAKFNYYNGRDEESLNNLITGILNNEYPRSRIVPMSEMLLNDFIRSSKKDQSLKLLNALILNTTSDNVNTDALLNWYLRVDPLNGKKLFENASRKRSGSSFKKAGKNIKMPEKWNFIVNLIDTGKIKKAKYYFIDVWYTSCGPCILEIPELNAFHKKIKSHNDIQFLSINTDFINGKLDETYVTKRSKDLNVQFPVVYDNAKSYIARQLAVTSFPTKFIVDHTGQIITKIDNSAMTLEAFDMFVRELK